MSNALFKQERERVVFPPVEPPRPPMRRLVRKMGSRPRYLEYVTVDVVASEGDTHVAGEVTQQRERAGSENYEYYEWEVMEYPLPEPKPPVVTPIAPAWDSTARSGVAVVPPLVAEWVVGTGNLDLIVGLSTRLDAPRLPGESDAARTAALAAQLRASVVHGFRVVRGAAHIHSAPPPEFGRASLDQRQASIDVHPDSVCRVECAKGMVSYYVDGVLMATGPAYVHDGQAVYLRAALYGLNDTVADPSLAAMAAAPAEADCTLAPITARGGRYASGTAMLGVFAGMPRRTGVRATLAPLWGRGGRANAASLLLAPLAANGWGDFGNAGRGDMALAPLTAKGGKYADGAARIGVFAFGRGGAEVPSQLNPFAGLDSLLDAATDPRAHRGAYADAVIDCSFVAEYMPLRKLPAEVGVRGAMKAARLWPTRYNAVLGVSGPVSATRVFDVALVLDVSAAAPALSLLVLSAEIGTHLGAGVAAESRALADALLHAGVGAGWALNPQALYGAALRAVLGAGFVGLRNADDFVVWSVEQGGASAAYSGFAFNSFARLGGKIFAAADTGLYELGGGDDAGEPIAAWVDLGSRNFGSTLLKGISNAYLTASSDAPLVVHVTTEGKTYRYRARSASPHMQAQRVDFGRGLRATYLNLEISNDGGSDFDLERLEFVVNETTRRI